MEKSHGPFLPDVRVEPEKPIPDLTVGLTEIRLYHGGPMSEMFDFQSFDRGSFQLT